MNELHSALNARERDAVDVAPRKVAKVVRMERLVAHERVVLWVGSLRDTVNLVMHALRTGQCHVLVAVRELRYQIMCGVPILCAYDVSDSAMFGNKDLKQFLVGHITVEYC